MDIIKQAIKKKYQKVYFNKSQLRKIINFKNIILKKKIKLISNQKLIKEKKTRFFKTSYLLKNLSKKKYLSKKDKKIILNFYKKFSVHLKLVKLYNKQLKKKSNVEADIESYVYLGNLIFKIKELNLIQKFNCLLKLNDKVLIKLNHLENNSIIFKIFQNNLQKEIDITNYYKQ